MRVSLRLAAGHALGEVGTAIATDSLTELDLTQARVEGGALVVVGAVVFFTAPHASTTGSLQVLPTLGGVVARGAW